MTIKVTKNIQSLQAAAYEANATMTSLVSYPDRCHLWGDSGYRGNCDGTLFKDLVLRYQPRRVADPMMGSGTTRDVIKGLNEHRSLNIDYWGGDLKSGFNLINEDLPGKFDFVWIHPPYWNMISYGGARGQDLSSFSSYEDFLGHLRICLVRCSQALNPGGRLAVLVGDIRRSGTYTAIVGDVLNMKEDLGELRSVIIKEQHHCRSDAKFYGRMEDVPIKHEYCAIFKKG